MHLPKTICFILSLSLCLASSSKRFSSTSKFHPHYYLLVCPMIALQTPYMGFHQFMLLKYLHSMRQIPNHLASSQSSLFLGLGFLFHRDPQYIVDPRFSWAPYQFEKTRENRKQGTKKEIKPTLRINLRQKHSKQLILLNK